MAADDKSREWLVLAREAINRRFYPNVTDDEVDTVFQTMWFSVIGGGIIGGLVGMRETGNAHMLENRDTRYPSQYHAQKHLHQSVLPAFFKYGARWGLRAGFFATLFSVSALVIQHERDKKDLFNVVGAGVLTGAVYGVPSGPRVALRSIIGATLLSASIGAFQQMCWWLEESGVIPKYTPPAPRPARVHEQSLDAFIASMERAIGAAPASAPAAAVEAAPSPPQPR
eukprot:m.41239 g.41239  ORF g.41239 m.41239 type:complete len:227 (-) comp5659_c0_seq1:1827-2507(-)